MINDKKFLEIIDSTPLISIDLIIEDRMGRILLGKRRNRPARNSWFVPGGRIFKNETIASAIKRISLAESGNTVLISDADLLGAFDHIYTDNYLGKDGINTHYVVLAYTIKIVSDFEILTDSQHSDVRWWSKFDLLNSPEVHENTKNYFTEHAE